MRIYTHAGDLAFKSFDFSDSQPHFELLTTDDSFREATIETAIRTPKELLLTCLAADALHRAGYVVDLDIRYLLGARMDRPLSRTQPFTLNVIAAMLNSAGFRRVRVLDCHSRVGLDLLGAANVLPMAAVHSVIRSLNHPVIVIPDKGAEDRVLRLTTGFTNDHPIIRGDKRRNIQTGHIDVITLANGSFAKGKECLIIDDICDGGATFHMIANGLQAEGAKAVYLYVTHGIFSKGVTILGIDRAYTTDSYDKWGERPFGPVCVPVSMKEMP